MVLVLGYLLAKLVQKGASRALRRTKLNDVLRRGGVMQALDRSGTHFNPARVIANLLFWFVMFTVVLIAANARVLNVAGPRESSCPGIALRAKTLLERILRSDAAPRVR